MFFGRKQRGCSSRETGEWGERLAEKYLKRKGFKIIGRRVRVGAKDELDLIARDGESLVFVEVKTRKNEDFGRPISAVDRRKRHALCRAAVRYIKKLGHIPLLFRFDVIELVGTMEEGAPKIHHVENAFNLDRRYRVP